MEIYHMKHQQYRYRYSNIISLHLKWINQNNQINIKFSKLCKIIEHAEKRYRNEVGLIWEKHKLKTTPGQLGGIQPQSLFFFQM